MQSRQRRRITLRVKIRELTNFEPLLQDIRSKLGLDWEFYQDFLEGAIRSIDCGQDISAWVEQVELLVKGREDLAFSHQGVLFLLGEMTVKNRSEGGIF